MDDKKETKKKVKKGGKDKKEKGKKKVTKKKRVKTIKETAPSQFVQKQDKGTLGSSMGQTQPFGAGGLGGLLSALGIQPKFNQLGATTGFSLPTSTPIRLQQVAPKMEEKYIVEKPLPDITEKVMEQESTLYKQLDRGFKGQSKEEVRDHIYKFFGGDASVDMDYIIQDFLTSLPTKKAMLENVAGYMVDRRGGLFPSMINNFISFNPNEEEEEDEGLSVGTEAPSLMSETVNVEVVDSVAGESPSALNSVGFVEEEEEIPEPFEEED